MAGLQARCLLDSGKASERDFAEVVSRSRRDALDNPYAQVKKDVSVDALLAEPYYAAPLRKHDLPPISDGAAAVLIARGDRARSLTDSPIWIRGIDHRIESHHPGLRELAKSPSTQLAAEKARVHDGAIEIAELCVRYSPEEIVLREALGLGAESRINPSGGPLCGHPVMATGLTRVVELARRIRAGEARRGLAHAASGPALLQNLVCVLEGGA
jgi:acetyl-CoA acetyltransferase